MRIFTPIVMVVLAAISFNSQPVSAQNTAAAERNEHVQYVPGEMITKPETRDRLNEILKTWARPGDDITYKLEANSEYKFIGIKYLGDDAQFFTPPVMTQAGRFMTITVYPTAPSFETKSTLVVVKKTGGEPIDVDPGIIVGNFF